jgi:hypothetical protein
MRDLAARPLHETIDSSGKPQRHSAHLSGEGIEQLGILSSTAIGKRR